MQHGLISDWSGEQCVAVGFSRDGQAVEPGGPPVIKVSLDANLVACGLVVLLRCWACFTHSAPRAFLSIRTIPYLIALVPFLHHTLRVHVGRCRPHTWGLMWGYLGKGARQTTVLPGGDGMAGYRAELHECLLGLCNSAARSDPDLLPV
jgi:hypothetical protein